MEIENEVQTQQEIQQTQEQQQTPATDSSKNQRQEVMIPKTRFDEVNNRLREFEAKISDFNTREADYQTKLSEAQQRAQTLELAVEKMKIGMRLGLSEELLETIRGDTVEELTANAERLANALNANRPKNPGNTHAPARKTEKALDISQMSSDEVMENWDALVEQFFARKR